MLSQIEPSYIPQAFRTFEIYNAMSKHMERICALELDAAITAEFQSTMNHSFADRAIDEVENRTDSIEAHLKSRCAGFLEICMVLDSSIGIMGSIGRQESH